MSGPIVVITGCSSGVGMHAAVACAAAGQSVVATMRNTGKRDALDQLAADAGVEVEVAELDITDQGSIDRLVEHVLSHYGRIDALINNAGAGFVGTLEQTSHEDFQRIMDANFSGHVATTRAVLPIMRAQGSGAIISVTSVGGVVGQPFNDAYCAAKFAVEGVMESLAPVVAAFGISVSVVEPGAVASEFVANVQAQVDDRLGDEEDPYNQLFAAYVERTLGAFADAQDPAEVGAQLAEIVAEDQPAFRYQTSPRATAFAGAKLSDLDGSVVQGATRAWVGLPQESQASQESQEA